MKRAHRIKPVKAWTLVNEGLPYIYAYWTFDQRRVEDRARAWKSKRDRWIRVEIRPVQPRRRARRKA